MNLSDSSLEDVTAEAKAIHASERRITLKSVHLVGYLESRRAWQFFGVSVEKFAAHIGLSATQYWKRAKVARLLARFPDAALMFEKGETELSHLALAAGKITEANAKIQMCIRDRSIQPGWHTTIFPPYFVAGAILSGCAMVYSLLIPVRKMFRLEEFIRPEHLEACIKLTLLTSTIVFYAYALEFFVAWYSGNPYEWAVFEKRAIGPYAFYFWTMVFCNCIFPMVWWSKRMRNNIAVSMVVAVLINVGMWFERYNIIVSTLAEDFLPGSWGHFEPTIGDMCLTLGSFGWFFFWFLIFCRFFPIVSMSELKLIMPKPLSKKH